MNQLRILYVGPDYPGSNGTCWRDAFKELGHHVQTLNDERFTPPPRHLLESLSRRWTGRPPQSQIDRLNQTILREAREFRPHLTFYVKAYFVLPETVEQKRAY